MAFQRRTIVKQQIRRRIKRQRRQPDVQHLLIGTDGGQSHLGLCVVIGFRQKPREAKDHRPVCRMADAGKGQRAVQRYLQPTRVKGRSAQQVQKPPRRHHRPHRVRR